MVPWKLLLVLFFLALPLGAWSEVVTSTNEADESAKNSVGASTVAICSPVAIAAGGAAAAKLSPKLLLKKSKFFRKILPKITGVLSGIGAALLVYESYKIARTIPQSFSDDKECFEDTDRKLALMEVSNINASKLISSSLSRVDKFSRREIQIPSSYFEPSFIKNLTCTTMDGILNAKKRKQDSFVQNLRSKNLMRSDEDPRYSVGSSVVEKMQANNFLKRIENSSGTEKTMAICGLGAMVLLATPSFHSYGSRRIEAMIKHQKKIEEHVATTLQRLDSQARITHSREMRKLYKSNPQAAREKNFEFQVEEMLIPLPKDRREALKKTLTAIYKKENSNLVPEMGGGVFAYSQDSQFIGIRLPKKWEGTDVEGFLLTHETHHAVNFLLAQQASKLSNKEILAIRTVNNNTWKVEVGAMAQEWGFLQGVPRQQRRALAAEITRDANFSDPMKEFLGRVLRDRSVGSTTYRFSENEAGRYDRQQAAQIADQQYQDYSSAKRRRGLRYASVGIPAAFSTAMAYLDLVSKCAAVGDSESAKFGPLKTICSYLPIEP